MARLLFKAKDTNTPSDGPKPGHIVDIKPDGHVWGSGEVYPDFIQIDYPGIPESDFDELLEPEVNENSPLLQKPVIGWRKWKVDITQLPPPTNTVLPLAGPITPSKVAASRSQLRDAIKHNSKSDIYAGKI